MTAPALERTFPVWQTRPCPTWCQAVHKDADPVGSRLCSTESRAFELPLEELIHNDGESFLDAVQVGVEAEHGAQPRMSFIRADGSGYLMTLQEARRYALHILNLVEVAS